MDAEDTARMLSNREKVLAYLREHGSATNQRLRGIGGARAMGRVNELQKAGHPITVRKLKGAEWEIRYNQPALGPDAKSPRRHKYRPQQPEIQLNLEFYGDIHGVR